MPSTPPEQNRIEPAVTIVGSGNWRVASDNAGPMVLKSLAGRYGANVEIKDIGTSALGLLECLDNQDLMLIVDACVKGGAPGEIHVIQPDLEAPLRDLPGLHQIGPVETLMVAKQLYPHTLPKTIFLVLIETQGLDDADLGPVCQKGVSIIDQKIAQVFRADAFTG
ncbi:MAG: hydrogenase maturation protease [Desulfobacteraceae bacterium]|nr:hydrogenase maturation protease [Desulfobacteraceae bacterium]